MGAVEQTQPYQRKAVGMERQQIVDMDWGNYYKGEFTPLRAKSNWAGGDLGARQREGGKKTKSQELQFEETIPKEENLV